MMNGNERQDREHIAPVISLDEARSRRKVGRTAAMARHPSFKSPEVYSPETTLKSDEVARLMISIKRISGNRQRGSTAILWLNKVRDEGNPIAHLEAALRVDELLTEKPNCTFSEIKSAVWPDQPTTNSD